MDWRKKSAQGLAQRIQNTHNWKATRRLPLARSSHGAVNPYLNLSQSVTVVTRITAERSAGKVKHQTPTPRHPPQKNNNDKVSDAAERWRSIWSQNQMLYSHSSYTHTHSSHPTLYKSRTWWLATRCTVKLWHARKKHPSSNSPTPEHG